MGSKRYFEALIDRQWAAISLESSPGSCVARLPHCELKVDTVSLAEDSYSLLIDGHSFDVTVHRSDGRYQVSVNGTSFEVTLRDPKQLWREAAQGEDSAGPVSVTAPMPGKLVTLLVAEG
ncbi:MAG: hypothetical protein L0312_28580, partial [Acidobacteria bacterium]|nr:hypothetical protein [Acidobacteriota bacterium]